MSIISKIFSNIKSFTVFVFLRNWLTEMNGIQYLEGDESLMEKLFVKYFENKRCKFLDLILF